MSIKRSALFIALFAIASLLAAPASYAGNKRYMTINAAKVLAERSLLEMVYGLKVKASESVENMIASSFVGTAETKTLGLLKGVMYDEVIYDEEKDVAKVTASVKLSKITNINGETIDLKGKTYTRVAFATSTPSEAGPLKALRAAQIDAYKQLAKQLIGFTLESQTKVENYILSSDVIKSKIMATLIMADLNEYGWHPNGDAYVRMSLNLKDFKEIVGQGVSGGASLVNVEGFGAQLDDFGDAKKGLASLGAGGASAPVPRLAEVSALQPPQPEKVAATPLERGAAVTEPAKDVAGAAKPKGLSVLITADQQLNSNGGAAHALQLCLYQLKGADGFNQLAKVKNGPQSLMDCVPFDAAVARASRLVVQPGDRLIENQELAEGTRFVGVFVGYFAPGAGTRSYLAPLPAAGGGEGSSITLTLGPEAILDAAVR